MKEITFVVKSSLDARASAHFVQVSTKFNSNITIKLENICINGKSIMGMISLGLLDGKELTILADGDDENEAIIALERFLTTV